MNNTDSGKGVLYAVMTALLWGVLAIALKLSLQDLNPLNIVWMRFLISFVFLAAYVALTDPSLFNIFRKPSLPLIAAAIFLAVNYVGFMLGVHYTSPSVAQVYIQLGPVILAFSGIFVYKERVTKLQVVGILVVVAGLLVFYLEQIKTMIKAEDEYNSGVIWVVVGAVTWAIYAAIQKKLVKDRSTNQLNLVIYGLPILLFIPFTDFADFNDLSVIGWLILLFLGLNTLFAYTFIVLALKYLDANKVSVIITANPIITFIIMGILTAMNVKWIEHENFTLWGIIGATMVLSGAAIAILFSGRRNNAKELKKIKTP